MKDVSVGLRPGSEKANLAAWEQRHGVNLPIALKQLYLTTDGFSLTWNFTVAGKCMIFTYVLKVSLPWSLRSRLVLF